MEAPTEVSQLTIEYSGDIVTCETTQINPDSSVYLAGCKVKNRTVEGYVFGKDLSPSYEAYSLGDEVTYNGVDYYVLKDSDSKNNIVTLLKATPLTVDEVNEYGGVGTENNHVNRYTYLSVGTSLNQNGYGGVAYYSGEKCGYVDNVMVDKECYTDYLVSDIKYIVDNWAIEKINKGDLINTRLITYDEYMNSTFVETYQLSTSTGTRITQRYSWMYNSNYEYWTMSPYFDSSYDVYEVGFSGGMGHMTVTNYYNQEYNVVRPVVELYKNDGIKRKTTNE